MEIYVEYILIDNLIINFLILWLTVKLLKIKIKKIILITSSILGAVCSVFIPLIELSGLILLLIKLLIGLAMIIILKKFSSIKEIITIFLVFITITFVFGGMCVAILIILNKSCNIIDLLMISSQNFMSIYIIPIFIYSLLLSKIIKVFYKKKHIDNYICNVIITILGKKYTLKGFIDTGNNLVNKNGNPIIVLSYIKVPELFLKLKSNLEFKNLHYEKIITAIKLENLLVFDADEVEVFLNNKSVKNNNVSIGVTKQYFQNFDCLLNVALI